MNHTPVRHTHVKIILKTGQAIEGLVVHWSDSLSRDSQLVIVNKSGYLVIPNMDSVLAFETSRLEYDFDKEFGDPQGYLEYVLEDAAMDAAMDSAEKAKPAVIDEEFLNIEEKMREELKDLPTYQPDARLRALGLAELKKKQIAEEKAQVKEELTRFKPDGGVPQANYNLPGFFKKKP